MHTTTARKERPLSGFWQRRALNNAARRFAAKLGPQLLKDYGSAENYTPRQIEASTVRAGLSLKHIKLGLAGFTEEETFCALSAGGSASDYAALRTLLHRQAKRPSPTSAFAPAAENSDATAGFTHSGS